MQKNTQILIPEATYHVYNRANGSEKLFVSNENYHYFLLQYQKYIEPVTNTFCYCLMPNHFHFLIRIRSQKELQEFFKIKTVSNPQNPQGFKNLKSDLTADPQGFKNLEGLIAQQFSNFFNAYAKAFNKQHNRKGSLFMHPFKRKEIPNMAYLLKLVHYIHHNPVEAVLCKSPEKWPHSSYGTLINNNHTFLKRGEVINWFEDLGNFIHCHTQLPELTGIHPV